ncbi:auxin-binding protein [Rubrivivax gelatinosus]|uniref:cupin domain-containing protein n=1 Tax=Rubrivivax gelatinosus TaxID=28068 RepID=UPI001904566F|nr:cupin domain-containing protein [Rubrivivax gelatinosus]MBK1615045.1 auxin-binding protein [Rubrivivax gelatinosus]
MPTRAEELASRLIRNLDTVEMQSYRREPLYAGRCARLAPGTAARKLGASIDIIEPGQRACPYHLHHAQEEMFVVLAGSGTLRVAGELLPLKTGDVVFMPAGPEYPHQIINSGEAPLKLLSVSTMESPEICEYPDSGKYHASARDERGTHFDAIARGGETLDYWEGEP